MVAVDQLEELEVYWTEINRFPLLTQEEEYTLAVRFREHADLEAAHRLVSSYLRYVVRIAREYHGYYGLRLMDLVQEGSIGLMQAVKRFDPHKGFRLATYALWWIRAAIQEYILRTWSLVRIGTSTAQRKLIHHLRRIRQRIDSLDTAQAEELAGSLGIDSRAVWEMEHRLAAPDESLNRSLVDGGEDVQNLLIDSRPNQELTLLASEEAMWRHRLSNEALATLDPRERLIVEQRIMADTPVTLEQIGEQMGISRERVRQLEKRSLAKMRRAVGDVRAP
ncbi:MAG: RNA polymerase factor sigma-32 [Magnetococcales bacterium]|nr:RNA polymerase factor sigma-32 [Magnetococcales bacterium]MBF0322871.1 RNA polymerase factor sigma-32 [Magnetococcales bacterium]